MRRRTFIQAGSAAAARPASLLTATVARATCEASLRAAIASGARIVVRGVIRISQPLLVRNRVIAFEEGAAIFFEDSAAGSVLSGCSFFGGFAISVAGGA